MPPFGYRATPPPAGLCQMCVRMRLAQLSAPLPSAALSPPLLLCGSCDTPKPDLTLHKLGFWEVV